MTMELDDLKSQLNHKLASDHMDRSNADIEQLLQKRTNSVVSKLKRSLLFEIKLSVPSILLFALIGILGKEHSFRIFFSVFTFFLIGTMSFLIYLYKRTATLSSGILPVKANLQTIVNIIEEFIKRCFQFSLLLIPVGIGFLFVLQYYYGETATFSSRFAKGHLQDNWKFFTFMIIYIILFTVFMYYFAKWYLHKLYGKYVAQLKECIAELEGH